MIKSTFYNYSDLCQLPVLQCKNKILEKASKHDNLLIMSETGSGKSTKIPQFFLNLLPEGERIICTQPRRIAAISLAKRVSMELRVKPGKKVGYMVRFDNKFTESSQLIYATDGSLLRESIADPLLMRYSIVILDEAHERTLHTDILFGVVKNAQAKRKEQNLIHLKIIIMSATICLKKFKEYFNAEVVYIEGRNFPIEYFYLKKNYSDYFNAAYRAVVKLHREKPLEFDILVFLSGQEEIESLKQLLSEKFKDMIIYSLFSALPLHVQMNIFIKIHGSRRVILSTNIAETSITIPGVKIVIDSGVAKIKSYDPITKLVSLKVEYISRSEARQRSGRVGRTESGLCYRLYPETTFYEIFEEESRPELLRSNLSLVLLTLLASGIKNPLDFDWIDTPPAKNIETSWQELLSLGAVIYDSTYFLTPIGSMMSKLPLEPRFSKCLILASKNFNCSVEMVTLIAFLNEKHIFFNPSNDKKKKALNNRKKFTSEYGDIITLLNVFKAFTSYCKNCRDGSVKEDENNLHRWCTEHSINLRSLMNVKKIRKQLFSRMKALDLPIVSAESTFHNSFQEAESIVTALLCGFYDHTAIYSSKGMNMRLYLDRAYLTILHREMVHIHPSSILHGTKYRFVLFTEKLFTTNNYIRHVSVFHLEWLKSIIADDQVKREMLLRLQSYEDSSRHKFLTNKTMSKPLKERGTPSCLQA
ncbi:hypothetical protein HZS_6046, partial [Henneguya salminicola]